MHSAARALAHRGKYARASIGTTGTDRYPSPSNAGGAVQDAFVREHRGGRRFVSEHMRRADLIGQKLSSFRQWLPSKVNSIAAVTGIYDRSVDAIRLRMIREPSGNPLDDSHPLTLSINSGSAFSEKLI